MASQATTRVSADFLRRLLKAVPYKIGGPAS